jgi:hypothetical protein
MDLDKKLKKIETTHFFNGFDSNGQPFYISTKVKLSDQNIEEIKQAFEGAEYTKAGKIKTNNSIYCNNCGARVALTSLMTGQEWYDRFKKELPEPHHTARELNPHGQELPAEKYFSQGEKNMHAQALSAAKKAAGLE